MKITIILLPPAMAILASRVRRAGAGIEPGEHGLVPASRFSGDSLGIAQAGVPSPG